MNVRLSLLVVLVGLVVVGSMGSSRAQGDGEIDLVTHAVAPETASNPTRVSLVWNGGAAPYQVQLSESLPAVWSPATGEMNETAATVSVPRNVYRRFYRVVSGDNIIPANFITLPAAGSTLTAPLQPDGRRNTDVTVSWELDTEVPLRWWIYGESEPGVIETRFYNSGSTSSENRSTVVSGIPFDGSNVTIRLWWETASEGWTESRVTYGTEALGQITAPVPGTRLSNSGVFALAPNGLDVAIWWIYVGSTIGGQDYINSNPDSMNPSNPALPYSNIPSDGSVVYVRLFWKLSSPDAEFQSRDYRYLAPEPPGGPVGP